MSSSHRLSFSQRLKLSRKQKATLPPPPHSPALRPGLDTLTIAEFQDPGHLLPESDRPVSARFFRSKLPQGRDLLVLHWASGRFAALGVSRANRHGVHLLAGGHQVPALQGRTHGRHTFVVTHTPTKLVLRLECKISIK